MLRLGVDIYEISARPPELAKRYGARIASIGRSHAKIAVIDQRTTFVGSMNMDFRSSRTNTELGMLIESDELAQQVCDLLQALSMTDAFRVRLDERTDSLTWTMTQDGAETVYEDEPDVGPLTRLKILLLSPLVPEDLL